LEHPDDREFGRKAPHVRLLKQGEVDSSTSTTGAMPNVSSSQSRD
jgi:hypothetical protein